MATSLGQTSADTIKVGRWTFNAWNGSNLTGIQEVNLRPESERLDVFQGGGGDMPLPWRTKRKWVGTMRIEAGNMATLAALKGLTVGAAGQYGIPFRSSDGETGWLERIVYDEKLTSIHFVEIAWDIIVGDVPLEGPMDRSEVDVPIETYFDPYILDDHDSESTKKIRGFRQQENGDGETVSFDLTHTPLTIDSTHLANSLAFYVKVDDKHITSGFTLTGGGTDTLVFDTAPDTGSNNIEILYAYDTDET